MEYKVVIDAYRDGGSLSIKTSYGEEYVIDRRFKYGNDIIWKGYPDRDGSKHATDAEIEKLTNEVQ